MRIGDTVTSKMDLQGLTSVVSKGMFGKVISIRQHTSSKDGNVWIAFVEFDNGARNVIIEYPTANLYFSDSVSVI